MRMVFMQLIFVKAKLNCDAFVKYGIYLVDTDCNVGEEAEP